MKDKLISFIIPHKGREHLLIKTVESVIQQSFDLSLVEIIIVTQNEQPSDRLHSVARDVSLSIHTRPTSETISSLRNFGVARSTGEYLAFLDADIALSANWIECMLQTLGKAESRVISSAIQVNAEDAPPLEKIRTALSNAVTDQNVSFLPGRNLFLKRDTFEKVNGFPDHLVTCEDYYFTDKANQLGDLYYTSDATYVHLGEDKDFGEMFNKEIWRGQSNLLSVKGRSIPLNEIPSFIVPVGVMFLLILAILLLASGYDLLASISFLLFLLPIAVYSIRLYKLTEDQVSFYNVLKFYLYYFPARAIGTIGGLFKTLNTKSHH